MGIGSKQTYFSLYNLESPDTCTLPLHQKIGHRHRFVQAEVSSGTWDRSETGHLCNEVSILVVEVATSIFCGSNGSVPSVDVSSVGDGSGKLWHLVVNGGSSSVLTRIVQ